MTDAVDHASGDKLHERRGLIGILRGWCAKAVAAAVQGDRRRLDTRTLREPLLDLEKSRLARRIADPVAIRMNDDVDEVRVVEGCGRALVGLRREAPGRRPRLPQEPA